MIRLSAISRDLTFYETGLFGAGVACGTAGGAQPCGVHNNPRISGPAGWQADERAGQ